tara:strand:- start:627 stop:866 length:240 start_codon:yes stop_codon:yes gene_type:complete
MSSKKFEKEVENRVKDLEEYTNLLNEINNQKIALHGKEKVMSDLAKEFALKPIKPMKSYFTINRWTKRAYLDWRKKQRD